MGQTSSKSPAELTELLTKNDWAKRSGFADPEKIFPRILCQSVYESESLSEYEQWDKPKFETISQEDPNLATKLKPLIRRGVPNEFKRAVVLKLFGINCATSRLIYDNALKVVFGEDTHLEHEFAPTFSTATKLDEAVPVQFVNKAGIEAEKRILWVLNQQYHVEYSPLIPVVLSLLLVFLKEDEAFLAMRYMIERSGKTGNSREIRWHLTLRKADFGKLINAYMESYYQLSRNKGRKNLQHFREIGYEPRLLVESLFSTFFLEYVQFHLVMKMFMVYLCEGTKTLFRMSYAVMKRLHETIMGVQDRDKVLEVLKREGPSVISDSHYIMRWGFRMALTRYNNSYVGQKPHIPSSGLKLEGKTLMVYKHKMDVPSQLISDDDMEYLFQSLGNEYQICGLSLVFATSRHGYWLTTLYANTGKAEGTKGMFFCVKTSTGTVFGGFCNVLFKITQACHIGGDASFVFTLKPKRAVYKSAGSNTFFLCCDNKHFTFGGGGKGEAIRIDEDFATGVSYPSATFANRPLAGEAANGQFGCSDFEVYVLR